ncbi:MAG: hypothetical protein KA270_07545 [Saprospiraceae bacterium]|nr:hypothetical protein [Saprospiraceae bacterium]MBP6234551.1 hypothetical protein [Saprospiraceae bacterium]MBP6567004.1 hypothetical protein [Saprospiraceae bacterium]
MKAYIAFLVLPLLFLFSCKDGFNFNRDTKDPIIAKVGEKNLFKSQIAELIHPGTSPTDSAAIVDGYIENWIRENLMILEAEKNVAADINLNKLVDDYRSSLLVYNFEKRLVDQMLDTVITMDEKRDYYESFKNQYLLSHPIFKCVIAKVSSKASGLKDIKNALGKADMTESIFLIKEKAVYHHLDTAKWMTIEDLESLLPKGMIEISELSGGKVFQKKEKDYEYFVKIITYYDEKRIPPFDYIEGKIIKTILSERKIELLKKYRQDLYDQGISDQKFEVFKPE